MSTTLLGVLSVSIAYLLPIFPGTLVRAVATSGGCYHFANVQSVKKCNSCTGPTPYNCTKADCATGYKNFSASRGVCQPSCDKGHYLVDGNCRKCPQDKKNLGRGQCVACNRYGECTEVKCKPGYNPSWKGTWAAGFATCQQKSSCTTKSCGSSENTCFSLHNNNFLCHCAEFFEGGFPSPNKACKLDSCTQVNCGGPSTCVPSRGYFTCKCADGSITSTPHLPPILSP